MPTVITKFFKNELINGSSVNLSGVGQYKVALVGIDISGYLSTTLANLSTWISNSATYGVTGIGYADAVLVNPSIAYMGINVVWDVDDTVWENVSVTAFGCCIYRASDTMIVGFIDFGEPKVAVNGSITIQWNNSGVMNII